MNLNVAIIGHVDHGKSTLIGRLLYDSEALPKDKIAEIQRLIEEYKKSFEFAYFLDSFEEELKEERTIDTTGVLFKGKDYYTIVDVPGHKEFIKNMLTGACQSQIAILVISAPDGVQEQTRRHTFLLSMLGIKDILVAVNKMDIVGYQQKAFDKIKKETIQTLPFLNYSRVRFIPISAIEGDNIYKPSTMMEWYRGPTLMQTLDAIEPEETSEKPLRFVVQDTYPVDHEEITVGRIESGVLKRGDELIFQPSAIKGKVEKIKVYPKEIEEVGASVSIGIIIGCKAKRGDVGGHLRNPPFAVGKFLGEVVLLDGTLKVGGKFEIKCGTKRTSCLVERIKEQIDSETGEVINENIEGIGQNEVATIIFKTESLVVERFSDIPQLGRFILTKRGKNVGVGVILNAKHK